MKGNWRILRDEQLYDLYCPPAVIGVWKYRLEGGGWRSARHVACTIVEIGTRFWCGNVKERSHLEDLRVDGRVIQKYTVEETRMDNLECWL